MEYPPLPRLVPAAEPPAEEALVVLGADEQEDCTNTVDVALFFDASDRADPAALVESLARTLTLFPVCAGRFVKRTVKVEGLPSEEARRCILCNNAGAAFEAQRLDGPAPAAVGALPQVLFDRAVGTRPLADGSLGGPVLRVRCSDFADGVRLLLLSFSQGLCDAAGAALFLRAWSRLHRGEDPGPEPSHERTLLEAAVRNGDPTKLDASFALLHRRDDENGQRAGWSAPAAASDIAPRVQLASFIVPAEEVRSTVATLTEACRKKRFIYDSETLKADEALFAQFLVGALQRPTRASLSIDYRAAFFAEDHFGNAWGLVDIDLPRDPVEAAGVLHRHPAAPSRNRDFWAWKRVQARAAEGPELVLGSWIEAFGDLAELRFGAAGGAGGAGAPVGLALGAGVWQQWADKHGADCPGYVLLLPQPGGAAQVMALVPRAVAKRLESQRECHLWNPE